MREICIQSVLFGGDQNAFSSDKAPNNFEQGLERGVP